MKRELHTYLYLKINRMKAAFLTGVICLSFCGSLKAFQPAMPTDTTIRINNKRIEIREVEEKTKVRVYELDENGDRIDGELVFEGHYKDGKSYESRRHSRTLSISLPSWDKDFEGHWAGFGMGFANFADGSLHINDINGVSLRSETSLEYNLNFLEKSFPFSKYNWAIVTGAGFRWSRYRLNTNSYFKENEQGITVLQPAPEGVEYSKSKLNITSFTIPVLLEWQSRKIKGDRFFFSAGVVGVIKTISSSKVVFRDENNKKRKDTVDRGMNIRPVTMDFLIQGGYDWVGFYLKYAPIGLFESGKGPRVHPVAIGLHFHI